MFGISFTELMVISLLVLVVLGPEKLPEVAKWAGKGMRELRKASNTLRDAFNLEDLDRGLSQREQSQKVRPTLPEAGGQAGAAAADETTPVVREFPTSGPPANLDQIDDSDFDRMLEEHYLVHHSQLHAVELPPALPGQGLVIVELLPRAHGDESTLEVRAVDMPSPIAVEYAS